MDRVKLGNGGWFDKNAAKEFCEATFWNGNNWISKITGSQWNHQTLYQTAKGRWILHSWSQWQGSVDSYEEIDSSTAYIWLTDNDHENAVPAAFLEQMEL